MPRVRRFRPRATLSIELSKRSAMQPVAGATRARFWKRCFRSLRRKSKPLRSNQATMSAPPQNALQGAIHKLAFREPLSADDAQAAFDIVMRGEATAVQVAALLSALRATGERVDVVAGVVRALRTAMVALSAEDPDGLVDTCGTGGGAVATFNISTVAAIVAAGAGVRIAKHGNRSFTTKCGSADVLEALGGAIEVPVSTMEASLRDSGIVFMFAPLMHPAMRHTSALPSHSDL